MAEKPEKEHKLNSNITGDSVRVVSEAVGITGLPESAAAYLAEDCTYRLKQVVQVSNVQCMYPKLQPPLLPSSSTFWSYFKCPLSKYFN